MFWGVFIFYTCYGMRPLFTKFHPKDHHLYLSPNLHCFSSFLSCYCFCFCFFFYFVWFFLVGGGGWGDEGWNSQFDNRCVFSRLFFPRQLIRLSLESFVGQRFGTFREKNPIFLAYIFKFAAVLRHELYLRHHINMVILQVAKMKQKATFISLRM